MSEGPFCENVQRWALFFPQEAEQLSKLTCSHVDFSITSSGEPNLKRHLAGQEQMLHSDDPHGEARQWFAELDLYQVSVLYVFGVGLGYYYDAAQEWLQNKDHYLVFLEDDLEVIHRLFETDRGTRLLYDKQVRLGYVDKADRSGRIWNWISLTFWRKPFQVSILKSYASLTPDLVVDLHAAVSNRNDFYKAYLSEYLSLGQSSFRNFYSNLLCLPQAYRSSSLMNQFHNVPAIICGAGPSLDKNLAVLETLADRALIFAGGTAMNAVNSHGFLPHFGVGIDPHEEQLTRIIMNKAFEVPFLYRSRFNHEALCMVQGQKLYVTGSGGHMTPSWIEKQLGIEGSNIDLEEGYNVINFSLSLACAFGCNPIILVGVDLAYSGDQSYQSGVAHHPTNIRNIDFRTKGIHDELLIKSDIYGQPVQTLWKWMSESSWFSQFARMHPNTPLINATEGGIGMTGIPNIPLDGVAKNILLRPYDLRIRMHGEIQNAHMPANVTKTRILQLINQLQTSLTACQTHCQNLQVEFMRVVNLCNTGQEYPSNLMTEQASSFLDLLTKEIAFTYVLQEFDTIYPMSIELELQNVVYESDISPNHAAAHKARLQVAHYQFLHNVATEQLKLIQTLKNEEEQQSKYFEEPANSAPLSNLHQEGYSFENGILKINDPELNLDLQDKTPTNPARDQLHYPNGAVKLEQFYINGMLHGPVTFYSNEGSLLAQTWYNHGVQQGKAWFHYYTGQLYGVNRFIDGQFEGLQQYYYPDGRVKTLLSYLQGQLNGEVLLFHPNGQKKRELHFHLGKRHGKEFTWTDTGRLLLEAEYCEDRPIGQAKKWYANGQLALEITFDSNSKPSSMQRWSQDGQLVAEPERMHDDFFDSVVRDADTLTSSLESACENLIKVKDLLIPESQRENYTAAFADLKQKLEHLEMIKNKLLAVSGLQSDTEPVWKSPFVRREMQKMIEDMTSKFSREIDEMQELVKFLADKNKEKK